MAGPATMAVAVLGALLSGWGTAAYLRDVLRGRTVPHRGSWLVWSVIALVALVAHGAGGGRWSLLVLGGQAAGNLAVLALAVRRGTGGVTAGNAALVLLAGFGVAGWMWSDDPVTAVACAALADGVGLLVLVPKIWVDPHSETTSTYALAGVTGLLTVVSLPAVETSLLVYPGYFCLANAATAQLISSRRRAVRTQAPAGVARLPAQSRYRSWSGWWGSTSRRTKCIPSPAGRVGPVVYPRSRSSTTSVPCQTCSSLASTYSSAPAISPTLISTPPGTNSPTR
jgi:hypothetical protein